jgi:hypothetical protein
VHDVILCEAIQFSLEHNFARGLVALTPAQDARPSPYECFGRLKVMPARPIFAGSFTVRLILLVAYRPNGEPYDLLGSSAAQLPINVGTGQLAGILSNSRVLGADMGRELLVALLFVVHLHLLN